MKINKEKLNEAREIAKQAVAMQYKMVAGDESP